MPELLDGSKKAQRPCGCPRKLAAARAITCSNMAVVNRPVFVFCREQW
jgi:hypothetical protein